MPTWDVTPAMIKWNMTKVCTRTRTMRTHQTHNILTTTAASVIQSSLGFRSDSKTIWKAAVVWNCLQHQNAHCFAVRSRSSYWFGWLVRIWLANGKSSSKIKKIENQDLSCSPLEHSCNTVIVTAGATLHVSYPCLYFSVTFFKRQMTNRPTTAQCIPFPVIDLMERPCKDSIAGVALTKSKWWMCFREGIGIPISWNRSSQKAQTNRMTGDLWLAKYIE